MSDIPATIRPPKLEIEVFNEIISEIRDMLAVDLEPYPTVD
jgi:hypothetical protein